MSDDYTQDTLTTGVVSVGDSATGELETRGDIDWFEVTLQAGRTYRFDLEGSPTGAGALADPYLPGIYDNVGHLIPDTDNDDGGAWLNSRLYFTASRYGAYHVAAGAWQGDTGSYKLLVEEVTHVEDYETDTVPTTSTQSLDKTVDDYPTDTGSAGTVAVGASVTGAVDYAGDEDWFAVELVAERQYRIHLEGSATHRDALEDPYLRGIHDAAGNLLAGTGNDDAGAGHNSQVDFIAPESGTYYIAAYRLLVEAVFDDYPAILAGSGALTVGGSATGEIERAGDEDWFAIELIAGRRYEIDLEGWWTGRGALVDPYLRGIHDAAGNLIAGTGDDDGGERYNSRLDFTAPESETYYIAAGAYGEHTGDYRLTVDDAGDDYPTSTRATGTVAVGGSAMGAVDYAGDEDWFEVELVADREYQIHIEGSPTDRGTLSDPYLYGIHDSDGNLIANTDDDDGGTGLNSSVYFVAPDSGAYYIAAGAFGEHIGTYTVGIVDVL